MINSLKDLINGPIKKMYFIGNLTDTGDVDVSLMIKEFKDDIIDINDTLPVKLKAKLFKVDKVFIASLLIRLNCSDEYIYEIYMNYYEEGQQFIFERLSTQEEITILMFDENSNYLKKISIQNTLKDTFDEILLRIRSFKAWEDREYEIAKVKSINEFHTPKKLWYSSNI